MSTKIIKNEHSTVEATATLNKDAWKAKQEKALKKIASQITVKGFRKGEAPMALAEKHINKMDVFNEAINDSLDELLQEVVTENKVNYFACRSTTINKCTEDELEVGFVIATTPTVNLGAYKGLNVELEEVKVSKEEITTAINKLLDNEAELIIKEGKAEMGDTVVFDFKGYINGKEFEGGSADNYELVLGSGQFIPGFEDQLVGASSNDKIDVNVTFPEQYVKDLAGKPAKFVCKIHEIKTKQLPELNDEFVEGLGIDGVKTVADLEKHEESELVASHTRSNHEKAFREILAKIVEATEFDFAPEIIKQEADAIRENFEQQLSQNNITFEQYCEMLGLTREQVEAQFEAQATQRLKEYLTIMTIGSVEHIGASDEDLAKYYEQVAQMYGMEVEKVKETLSRNESRIRSELSQDKIERFILDNNLKVKEEKAKKAPKAAKESSTEPKEEAPKAKKTAKKTTKKEAE